MPPIKKNVGKHPICKSTGNSKPPETAPILAIIIAIDSASVLK